METCKTAYFFLLLLLPALYADAQRSFVETGNNFGGNPVHMNYGDFEGDGDIDLIVSNLSPSFIPETKIYLNDGSGNYSLLSGFSLPGYYAERVAFIDMEGDNDMDVIITGQDPMDNSYKAELYRNDGTGFTLVAGTPFAGVSNGAVEVGDMDGDNDEDILIMGEALLSIDNVVAYYNDGSGNFTRHNVLENNYRGGDASLGDIDGDNDLDILLSGRTQSSVIIENLGAGSFSLPNNIGGSTPDLSQNLFVDLDGDNDLDAIVSGSPQFAGDPALASLHQNDGSGNFSPFPGSPLAISINFSRPSLAVADFDGDNDNDIYFRSDISGGFFINNGLEYFHLDTVVPVNHRNLQAIALNVSGDSKSDLFLGGYDSAGNSGSRLHTNTTSGMLEHAIEFDGVNYYTAPHDNVLNTLPITFEMKVKASPATQNAGLIGNINYQNGGTVGWDVYFQAGVIYCQYVSDPSNYALTASFFAINDNNWHDIAIVLDTDVKLYIDGVLHRTLPWNGTPAVCASTQDLIMGQRGGSVYNGMLDEVRVWNTARTFSEIATNMCVPITDPASEPNLIAYYNMDDYDNFSNSGIMDKTPHNNPMTLTAGTLITAAEQAVCTPPILPVELTRFTADTWQGQIRLEWATASESNNKGFHIERSTDGADWKEIGFVHGNGDSNTPHAYSFLDKAPKQGMNYYRLKQVDFDEGHEYSDLVHAAIPPSDIPGIRIFPNPAAGNYLDIKNETGDVQLAIQDCTGKTIRARTLPQGSHQLDIGGLPKGIYFISISSAEGLVSTTKWVRQ